MTPKDSTLEAIKTIVQEENRGLREELKEEVTTLKSEILTSVDAVSKKLDIHITERTILRGNVDEHETELKRVKHRVTRVEKKVGVEPMTT